mgnify:CR=1 FL=1
MSGFELITQIQIVVSNCNTLNLNFLRQNMHTRRVSSIELQCSISKRECELSHIEAMVQMAIKGPSHYYNWHQVLANPLGAYNNHFNMETHDHGLLQYSFHFLNTLYICVQELTNPTTLQSRIPTLH